EPAAPCGTGVAGFVDLGAVNSASPRIESAAAADVPNLTIRLDWLCRDNGAMTSKRRFA
ncbi:hypothetical protein GWC77_28795, partial [Paraburkholderia sp. NMBU_R16]|nr:hypothetical protein [Paraburkholderia sp. NMBU_R16]